MNPYMRLTGHQDACPCTGARSKTLEALEHKHAPVGVACERTGRCWRGRLLHVQRLPDWVRAADLPAVQEICSSRIKFQPLPSPSEKAVKQAETCTLNRQLT